MLCSHACDTKRNWSYRKTQPVTKTSAAYHIFISIKYSTPYNIADHENLYIEVKKKKKMEITDLNHEKELAVGNCITLRKLQSWYQNMNDGWNEGFDEFFFFT